MESADSLDPGARQKRKTTYTREHPTENPKPPKRTKEEVQQAALEKREAAKEKKRLVAKQKEQKHLDEKKERQLSARKIAVVEDSVQRSQKQLQLQSERPDIATMETYQATQNAKQDRANVADEWDTDPVGEDLAELPPASTIDTDSDGAQLAMPSDEDDNSDIYQPSERESNGNGNVSDDGGGDSDASMEQLYQQLRKKR